MPTIHKNKKIALLNHFTYFMWSSPMHNYFKHNDKRAYQRTNKASNFASYNYAACKTKKQYFKMFVEPVRRSLKKYRFWV